MRQFLSLILLSVLSGITGIRAGNDKADESIIFQDAPFYFINQVPDKILMPAYINLSFFRNKLLVTQYRYRLETPKGVETEINRSLIIWSFWNNFDMTELMLPGLNQEGSYRLVIEYKPNTGTETKRFEKSFYVYRGVPMAVNPPLNKTKIQTGQVTTKPDNRNNLSRTGNNSKIVRQTTRDQEGRANNQAAADTNLKVREPVRDISTGELKKISVPVIITPKIEPGTENPVSRSGEYPLVAENIPEPDYNILIEQALAKNDTSLFRTAILKGAGSALKSTNGGNIFHLISDSIASEEVIGTLKIKGFSLDETDLYGNSPLHLAILSGRNRYAINLIKQGADLNIKNYMELSPLHLGVFLNNEEIVNELLSNGADLNLQGNSGYTPLHIASEMNNLTIAVNLLEKGALPGIKTNQALSPRAVAVIQNNTEMAKLIGKKGEYTVNVSRFPSPGNTGNMGPDRKQYPSIDFNLVYDRKMVNRRKFAGAIQLITIPVFVLSNAGTIYLKSRANHYYSLSKTAETEEIARQYYDKTTEYDRLTYIPAGISLVSVYGFIHSTLGKKNISRKMSRTFNLSRK